MSYGLETAGRVLGDLVGRGRAAIQQGGEYGAAGVAGGAAGGAGVGLLGLATGPGEVVIEPAAIGTGAALGGAIFGGYGVLRGAVVGTPGYADSGAERGRAASDWITQMTTAETKAKKQERVTTALDTACATCGCSQLAAGSVGPYRGGAHAFMQVGGNIQSHHMPPASVSSLPDDMGPAIQMDTKDHYTTPSFGRNIFSPFMRSQGQLANTGQFMTAFAIDAAAVEAQYPGKYTASIAQASAYAQCLKRANLVQ